MEIEIKDKVNIELKYINCGNLFILNSKDIYIKTAKWDVVHNGHDAYECVSLQNGQIKSISVDTVVNPIKKISIEPSYK